MAHGHKKGHGSSLNFLSIFRYLVGLTERFFINLLKNLKWLFTNSRTANNYFNTIFLRYFSNDYLMISKIILAGILLLILGKILVFVLVFWTIAKSI